MYEYETTDIPDDGGAGVGVDYALNNMALSGWRLVAVRRTETNYTIAYWERRKAIQ